MLYSYIIIFVNSFINFYYHLLRYSVVILLGNYFMPCNFYTDWPMGSNEVETGCSYDPI